MNSISLSKRWEIIILLLTVYQKIERNKNMLMLIFTIVGFLSKEHSFRSQNDSSRENLQNSVKAHQFLCGCPNKGGPPGTAGSAVLAREKASINSGLNGSNTTTPTWS